MPRKKEKPRKQPVILTDSQLTLLANKLLASRKNVYSVVKELFDIEIGEEVFEQLERKQELFKCSGCDEWKLSDQQSNEDSDHCKDCMPDEFDEEEED